MIGINRRKNSSKHTRPPGARQPSCGPSTLNKMSLHEALFCQAFQIHHGTLDPISHTTETGQIVYHERPSFGLNLMMAQNGHHIDRHPPSGACSSLYALTTIIKELKGELPVTREIEREVMAHTSDGITLASIRNIISVVLSCSKYSSSVKRFEVFAIKLIYTQITR